MKPPPRPGFLGRRGWVWTLIAGWFIPAVMTCAYVALAFLSEIDASLVAWLSIGWLFVLVLWWMIRELTQSAAIARAIAVGDADAVLEIANHALAAWLVIGRSRLVLYQAVAYELRRDWPRVLEAVAKANVKPTANKRMRVLAATTKITGLVETGAVAEAREVLDRDVTPVVRTLSPRLDAQLCIAAELARGRVLAAEGASAEAKVAFASVIDDVRTGARARAIARELLGDGLH